MDPTTGLTILGGAIGSAKLVEKLLGPTAEYLGDGLKTWTDQRVKNVGKIFEKAEQKLGGKIDTEGVVSPRVLKGILSEGSFCDDEIAADYFGGVLASSRSGISRDDRGASFISLISRLSIYQIRAHFILYSTLRSVFSEEKNLTITLGQDRAKLRIYIPFISFSQAMEFSDKEDVNSLTPHIMFGLNRENLIGTDFEYGNTERHIKCGGSGVSFIPSALGSELFLWVSGNGDISVSNFFKSDWQFNFDVEISLPKDATPLNSALKSVEERAKRLKPEF